MGSAVNGPRFVLAPPGRKHVYAWLAITLLFVVWIPLTWTGGGIADRSRDGAYSYFGVSAVFIVIWIGAFVLGFRSRRDPLKNFVEIAPENVLIQLRGALRWTVERSNIDSAEFCHPTLWAYEWLGVARPTILLRLRHPNTAVLFLSFSATTIRLPVNDPGSFLDALGAT